MSGCSLTFIIDLAPGAWSYWSGTPEKAADAVGEVVSLWLLRSAAHSAAVIAASDSGSAFLWPPEGAGSGAPQTARAVVTAAVKAAWAAPQHAAALTAPPRLARAVALALCFAHRCAASAALRGAASSTDNSQGGDLAPCPAPTNIVILGNGDCNEAEQAGLMNAVCAAARISAPISVVCPEKRHAAVADALQHAAAATGGAVVGVPHGAALAPLLVEAFVVDGLATQKGGLRLAPPQAPCAAATCAADGTPLRIALACPACLSPCGVRYYAATECPCCGSALDPLPRSALAGCDDGID
eukprot:TRINITY_DN6452_c0_g1_i1.p2 TRINITY_DN6452_c0_g1~~TRINITY_DN6452_c0_g1_i1.p2  ORF type:complete len:327 (+),score=85.00 TRINITY_DN6452_c0_g1_i1:87-983(+)